MLTNKVNRDQEKGAMPVEEDGFITSVAKPMTCTITATVRVTIRVCQRIMRNMRRTQRGSEVNV